MKSIIETSRALIQEKEDFVSFDEIIENLGETDFTNDELRAVIYSDLLSDGRFFIRDKEWNLKENFTNKEINKIISQGIVDDLLLEAEDALEDDDEEDIDVYEEEEINIDNFVSEEVLIDGIEDNINA